MASETLLIGVEDAARLLSVSVKTLKRNTAPRGLIPCVRIGDRVLYSPDSLRAWIAAHETHSTNTGDDAQ